MNVGLYSNTASEESPISKTAKKQAESEENPEPHCTQVLVSALWPSLVQRVLTASTRPGISKATLFFWTLALAPQKLTKILNQPWQTGTWGWGEEDKVSW